MTTTFTRTAIAVIFAAAALALAGAASATSNYVDYDKGSHLAAKTPELSRATLPPANAERASRDHVSASVRDNVPDDVDDRSIRQIGKLQVESRGR